MSSIEPSGSVRAGLTTADVRQRLDLLAMLGYGFLESGQTGGQTRRALAPCARSLRLEGLSFTSFGRMLLLETTLPDGGTVTTSGAARTLDVIDCARSRVLAELAADLATADEPASTEAERDRLVAARDAVRRVRDSRTPWWTTTLGMTMLAAFISMQVGVSWRAWASAAVVQVVSSLAGLGAGRIEMPKLFAAAVQSSAVGAFATFLVQAGFVDPVGAAAAIAVTWLLILPLPQVIGAVTDAIEGDHLSALGRAASVAVAAVGISVGGAFTFALGEALDMAHPKLDVLPTMPWSLVLVFSALGAVANAFANGGQLPLVGPAALLGVVTGATNQVFLRLLDVPALWASSASAVVLGVLAVVLATRTGYPQQVLALMGITGALLPGIPVFFGILQEMGGGSGSRSFVDAAVISVGIGTGVAFGIYVATAATFSRVLGHTPPGDPP